MKAPTSHDPCQGRGFSQVLLKDPGIECSLQRQGRASVDAVQPSHATPFFLPHPPLVLLSVS